MNTIYVNDWAEIPFGYTGRVIYHSIYPNRQTIELYNGGVLHCEDGPAIEYYTGYKAWWYEGRNYSAEEHFDVVFSKVSSEQQTWMLFNLNIWLS